jgi:DNA-directed RNA polymerase specialized sigma24 family protein
MGKLAQRVRESAYDDVRALVYEQVYWFVRKFNFDFEEAESVAGLAYAKAYVRYDRELSGMTTWVRKKVRYALFSALRDKIDERKVKFDPVLWDEIAEQQKACFDVQDWLSGLSEDARVMASLVFKTPMQIRALFIRSGGESSALWRLGIRMFLKECGWEEDRIELAFQQVKEAL